VGGRLPTRLLAQARVIAKGNRIRDVHRLVRRYGGRASKWVKKSSPQVEIAGDQFEYHQFEYHWYEHPGLGRFELKRKLVRQR
jgi:hypothetical protein